MSTESGDTDAVLAKADALIRRRRVFVAGKLPVEPDPVMDADIPVLTDVVDPSESASPAHHELPPELIERQNAYVLAAIESWLDRQLPQAVTSVLDRLSLRLIDDLEQQIRTELLPGLLEDSRQKLLFPLDSKNTKHLEPPSEKD